MADFLTPRRVIDEVKREVRFALGATLLLQRFAQQEAEALRRAEAARARRHPAQARKQQMVSALRELASELRAERLTRERTIAANRARAYAALAAESARARAAEVAAAAKRLEGEQRAEEARVLAEAFAQALPTPEAPQVTVAIPSELHVISAETESIAERDDQGLLTRTITRPMQRG